MTEIGFSQRGQEKTHGFCQRGMFFTGVYPLHLIGESECYPTDGAGLAYALRDSLTCGCDGPELSGIDVAYDAFGLSLSGVYTLELPGANVVHIDFVAPEGPPRDESSDVQFIFSLSYENGGDCGVYIYEDNLYMYFDDNDFGPHPVDWAYRYRFDLDIDNNSAKIILNGIKVMSATRDGSSPGSMTMFLGGVVNQQSGDEYFRSVDGSVGRIRVALRPLDPIERRRFDALNYITPLETRQAGRMLSDPILFVEKGEIRPIGAPELFQQLGYMQSDDETTVVIVREEG